MHCKVLCAGVCLKDWCIQRALEAADHGHSHLAGEIRVLTVSLHSPSPAGIAEYVDVGSPERKPLIPSGRAIFQRLAVLNAGLVTGGGEHFLQQFLVK